MTSSISFPAQPSLPLWLRAFFWLVLLASPTLYVLFVVLMDELKVPPPSDAVIVSFFCLIPILALIGCGMIVWRSTSSKGWRASGLALTGLAMLIQCSILLAILINAASVAIAPVP